MNLGITTTSTFDKNTDKNIDKVTSKIIRAVEGASMFGIMTACMIDGDVVVVSEYDVPTEIMEAIEKAISEFNYSEYTEKASIAPIALVSPQINAKALRTVETVISKDENGNDIMKWSRRLQRLIPVKQIRKKAQNV